jgi:dTDP-4-amino-4,6-dideoxygalactose transaminase
VLLPAYTCYEVATAAVGAGVRVALYDLDPETLEPDWDSVRSAAAHGAAALVVAPLYGLPLNWDIAQAIAHEIGALLIADAAQAHGSTWQQQPVGSIGDLTVLSFGRGKGWTGGGGGALLWRGAGAADAAEHQTRVPSAHSYRPLREAERAASVAVQWLLGRPSLFGLPSSLPFLEIGETVYHPPTPPSSMSRTSAALLIGTDAQARAEVSHRRSNAGLYSRVLSCDGAITAVTGARFQETSGALRFPLRIHGGWAAIERSEAPNLGAAPGYPTTLQAIPALRPLLSNPDSAFPGADVLAREVVTLPTHSWLTERDRRGLIGRIASLQGS